MGTNYYWNDGAQCSCCGRASEDLHIGKSSHGWCFSLLVYPELGINSLPEWIKKFDQAGSSIKNEYGEVIPRDVMIEGITERMAHGSGAEGFNYERNHADPGPNGLVRYKIGYGCIGHGEGTWDLIIGDFS